MYVFNKVVYEKLAAGSQSVDEKSLMGRIHKCPLTVNTDSSQDMYETFEIELQWNLKGIYYKDFHACLLLCICCETLQYVVTCTLHCCGIPGQNERKLLAVLVYCLCLSPCPEKLTLNLGWVRFSMAVLIGQLCQA